MHAILSRARRWSAPLAILALVAVVYGFGAFEPLERVLTDSRFSLLRRGVTGKLVVVAIDSRSLHALDTWPWPRDYHARLLDRLVAAGAKKIAFDVDFSAASTLSSDRALAAALARAQGRVILPVFAQRDPLAQQRPGVALDTFPAAVFRPWVLVGGVNVLPGPNGLVRQYSPVTMIDGAPMPSMAALLFGRLPAQTGAFYVDYGIRPSALTVLSYVDVLNGRFDPAAVEGKDVMVGATAIELGDHLAVPLHRTIPGPLVQALAYESLAQGRALHRGGALPTLGLVLFVLLVLERQFATRGWRRGLFALLAVATLIYGVALLVQAAAPLSADLAPALAGAAGLYGIGVVREVERQAMAALKHRMSDLQRRAMMQCVLEDSFDGIVIARADGTIELVNPAASRLFGHDPADIVGKQIDLFLPGSMRLQDTAFAVRQCDIREISAQQTPVELLLAGPHGETKTIEHLVSRSRLPVGSHRAERRTTDPEVFIHSFRDISERKAADIKLRDAMQQALAADRAKSEFLANMSHELRTPLNAIIGFSEVIREEVFEPIGQRSRAYASDINNSGQHLLTIINDVLDMAKIETGRFELQEEELTVSDLVAACLPIVDQQAKRSEIDLKVSLASDLPLVRADRLRLKQIVVNLLSNAVKFTPSGGRVALSASVQKNGALEMCISDTGIGMKPEELPLALEPFRQLESTFKRRYEGTGLGLPLARSLTELHGGTLEIESEPGHGTIVYVRLPSYRLVYSHVTQAAVTPPRQPSAAA